MSEKGPPPLLPKGSEHTKTKRAKKIAEEARKAKEIADQKREREQQKAKAQEELRQKAEMAQKQKEEEAKKAKDAADAAVRAKKIAECKDREHSAVYQVGTVGVVQEHHEEVQGYVSLGLINNDNHDMKLIIKEVCLGRLWHTHFFYKNQ